MFHFIILDVNDIERFDGFNYANLIDFQTFEDVSEANAECDKMVDRYLNEYTECDDDDFKEEDYVKSLYIDNEKIFRNVVLTFDSCVRQFMVVSCQATR